MKFIRNWLKSLIKEAVQDNFPPINITIETPSNEPPKVSITNCAVGPFSIRFKDMETLKGSNNENV